MIDVSSPRFHALTAAAFVLSAGALAFGSYLRWERLDERSIAIEPPPDLPLVMGATTATAPPATSMPRPDPCGQRQPEVDVIWPGRKIAVASDGRHASIIDCVNGRELFSAPGSARVEEGMLILREAKGVFAVERRLYGRGATLYEAEPRVMNDQSWPLPRGEWMQRVGGRYTIAPGADAASAPLRELALQEDGLFFARHGAEEREPYPAGSFRYGRWDFVDNANDAHIRIGQDDPAWEGVFGQHGVLTVGDVTLHRRMPARRFVWRHAEGVFQETGGVWEEISPRGQHLWTEQDRALDYVELADDFNACTVRLTMTQVLVRCDEGEKWTVQYEGGWE